MEHPDEGKLKEKVDDDVHDVRVFSVDGKDERTRAPQRQTDVSDREGVEEYRK